MTSSGVADTERSPLAETDEFPDPEVLAADILAAVEVPAFAAELWRALGSDDDPDQPIPLGPNQVDTDVEHLNAPCIRCYVPPGRRQLSTYGDLDVSFVYVQAWAPERRISQDMINQVRKLLIGFRDGGEHRGVAIFRVRETTGPGQLPQQPDAPDQLVESGWTFQLRRHRGATVR